MTTRSVDHATFSIERLYETPPARVFAHFASIELKDRWFAGPADWTRTEHEMDFRVGGRELSRVGPPGGEVHTFEGRYEDIIPDERIVFTYQMYLDETRISVSLTTVELVGDGGGTCLVFTEQATFLDGYDDAGQREAGTRHLLESLGSALRADAA
jgi:uncharacterized protein YndB with AHSA1/START domain